MDSTDAGPAAAEIGRPLAGRGRRVWPVPGVAAALALAAVVGLYWDTVAGLVAIWSEVADYQHGFAVPVLAAWLAWERLPYLRNLPVRPWPVALIGVIGASGLWLAGNLASVQLVEQVAFVGALQMVAVAIFGWRIALAAAFPLAFLFLMVPIGDGLIPLLQDITADLAVAALRLSGVAILHDGVFLKTPFGYFEVAKECSGLRFLTATITIGAAFTAMFHTTWWRRVAFMAICVVIPILANGARVFGIVLMAREVGIEAAAGFDHIIYGWVFLSFVTVIIVAIGWWMRQPPPPRPKPSDAPVDTSAGRTVLLAVVALAAVAAAAAGPGYAAWLGAEQAALKAPAALQLPVPGQAVAETPDWRPSAPGADVTARDAVALPDGTIIDRYVAYFSHQRQGTEAVSILTDLAGEELIQGRTRAIPPQSAGLPPVLEVTATGAGRDRLIWYWYWIGGEITTSSMKAKLLQLKSALPGGEPAAAMVAISVPVQDSDIDRARDQLRQFLGRQGDLSDALGAAAP